MLDLVLLRHGQSTWNAENRFTGWHDVPLTDQSGFCAVGSVKTNIGHTLTGSGAAGIIKILLALKYGQIPPSLHIGRTNPAIDFQGTVLMPKAKGDALVESKQGRTEIDAHFEHLTAPQGFGLEYMTYVLWAISSEGRPVNLGEVLPTGSNDRSHITVTTNLQSFGLMVTAEPYFAVTMPSDLVVAQNFVQENTSGVVKPVNAHYTLLPRGAYADTAGRHTVLHPITRNERTPLEVYEAENAVMIAAPTQDAGRPITWLKNSSTSEPSATDSTPNATDPSP